MRYVPVTSILLELLSDVRLDSDGETFALEADEAASHGGRLVVDCPYETDELTVHVWIYGLGAGFVEKLLEGDVLDCLTLERGTVLVFPACTGEVDVVEVCLGESANGDVRAVCRQSGIGKFNVMNLARVVPYDDLPVLPDGNDVTGNPSSPESGELVKRHVLAMGEAGYVEKVVGRLGQEDDEIRVEHEDGLPLEFARTAECPLADACNFYLCADDVFEDARRFSIGKDGYVKWPFTVRHDEEVPKRINFIAENILYVSGCLYQLAIVFFRWEVGQPNG